MAPAIEAAPAVVAPASRAGQFSRQWHGLGSGCATAPAPSAGGQPDIPACRRPVAGLLLADPTGTTGGRLCMVSSVPPCTDPYARWCGRGRRVTAAPMPITETWPNLPPPICLVLLADPLEEAAQKMATVYAGCAPQYRTALASLLLRGRGRGASGVWRV